MTDDQPHTIALNDAWNAVVRGNQPADQGVGPDEDQVLVHTLYQAVAMHYPAPDAGVAWQRVMAREAHRNQRAAELIDQTSEEILSVLVLAGAAHDAARPFPQNVPQSRRRSRWHSISSVILLAAVIVLALLGSIRGIVAWPPFQARPGDTPTTFQAVSSDGDPEVLAIDPDVLIVHLGSGWKLSSALAEIANVMEPMFDGSLGSTRFVFRGPEGALTIVEVLPVAADPSALASAWAQTDSESLIEMGRLEPETRSREAVIVTGCRQAIHIEGARKSEPPSPVGITLCAVESSEIVLVTTSGEFLGNEGWSASDRVATFVAAELAAAPIVPTHRFVHRSETESGLYQAALTGSPLLRPLASGTLLRWTGDVAPSPNAVSKTPWLKMRTADGPEGWVPGDLLIPAPTGEVLGSAPE